MTKLPNVVTQAEWLEARKVLLAREKELTRASDALNADRRRLPMVRVDAEYRFEGPHGAVTLRDLFDGRSQLAVYHFMFDPSWDAGRPGCTAVIDAMAPALRRHLATRDTSVAVISRAPLAKLERYRAERGWDLDWFSSYGTSFNVDFGVTIDAAARSLRFDERDEPDTGMSSAVTNGQAAELREISGLSFLLRDLVDATRRHLVRGHRRHHRIPPRLPAAPPLASPACPCQRATSGHVLPPR
jgi:predicted dithiol-disulfide oxidoreductase (DUF899 family)